jgi:hypothetical protein
MHKQTNRSIYCSFSFIHPVGLSVSDVSFTTVSRKVNTKTAKSCWIYNAAFSLCTAISQNWTKTCCKLSSPCSVSSVSVKRRIGVFTHKISAKTQKLWRLCVTQLHTIWLVTQNLILLCISRQCASQSVLQFYKAIPNFKISLSTPAASYSHCGN